MKISVSKDDVRQLKIVIAAMAMMNKLHTISILFHEEISVTNYVVHTV